jgi:hypothetical protein
LTNGVDTTSERTGEMSSEDDQHDAGEHGSEPPVPSRPSTPSASSVDFSAVSRSVWISAGGALVLLISVFLSWYTATASIKIANVSQSFSASGSGWDSGATAKFVALLALIALAAWVIELFVPTVGLPFPAWMIAGAAGAISVLFVLFKVESKPGGNITVDAPGIHASVGTAYGIWIALLAAIAVVVGAYMRMTEPQS